VAGSSGPASKPTPGNGCRVVFIPPWSCRGAAGLTRREPPPRGSRNRQPRCTARSCRRTPTGYNARLSRFGGHAADSCAYSTTFLGTAPGPAKDAVNGPGVVLAAARVRQQFKNHSAPPSIPRTGDRTKHRHRVNSLHTNTIRPADPGRTRELLRPAEKSASADDRIRSPCEHCGPHSSISPPSDQPACNPEPPHPIRG
jgi:hypothetical protein